MLRRAWKPVLGTALLVGAPSYLYYRHYYHKPATETFDLAMRVRGPDGRPTSVTRRLPLLSKAQADARLVEHATLKTVTRPGGVVWKQATAILASNDPIEDANASAFIHRDVADKAYPGDLLFFAVMDGHGGPETSRLLSQVLIPAVALELHQLTSPDSTSQKAGALQTLKALLYPTSSSISAQIPLDSDPELVKRAIQDAFVNLDTELVTAPLRILSQYVDKKSLKKGAIPDLSSHPMAIASMQPAISGSCAIMALFDTAHENLYVACTGDSRAVAGIYEESPDGQGRWRVEALSEDQTGRNPSELKRLQSEHPADEANAVVTRGRILGGLEPSRAFGDARYKWPREVQTLLQKTFLEGNDQSMRPTPALLKTPPYVTARPEVTHRKLSLPTTDSPHPASALRFVVLATDGLWDELSSEEVVALVGGYLQGLKGTVPKARLSDLVKTSTGAPTVNGKAARTKVSEGSWAFVDDNVGTHLIRNALGGGDDDKMRKLLSIPPPASRSYRDDITVTVVWWEDGAEASSSSTAAEEKVRAKL
ncbi:protein serine/threonine phosphatase 2C [Laetiporus sulphureus 93-53]|uniref:Protein serine/threonine phosphatase 2C n=1 Tax=Laetiporus sulphureus 93-53 TaxID=1314785 RepID=A0A165DUP8_9APHY|nr:protein serine/threonine phosphatase 2C [Laetiporus sulphureus 93-53]KZT05666.1 protein serine/threonine phosphatase 2C [Laetiporus sulphureus 93-53]